MSAAILLSEPPRAVTPIGRVRVDGGIRASLVCGARGTGIGTLHESGGYRLMRPRSDHGFEGVIVNTGGGMVGGDKVQIAVRAEAGTQGIITSQSAERVYRALDSNDTQVDVRLNVADGAALAWLPQGTILFDRARLTRRMNVDLAADARFVAGEMLVFGRTASGETMTAGALRDHWRITRGGKLIYADSVRIEGDIQAQLARPGIAGGAYVAGVLMAVLPGAVDLLGPVRERLEKAACRVAASAWDDMLILRGLADRLEPLAQVFASVAPLLMGRPLPRVWSV
ncbi:urease accessory protein UreD [Elstera litoralis]|uniref:urease accessory protein UreD n=1 Tax=Elstera litoralis TaxID=552518 RepID=UPI00069781E1|nr:urease accessory protein UreD [Elstera litoralis]